MRVAQSILAGVFCVGVAYVLGTIYVALAAIALFVALTTGIVRHGWHRAEDVLSAIGVAMVWPVLIVAYVVYRVDSARTAKLAAAASARATEARSARIEDSQHREDRNQR